MSYFIIGGTYVRVGQMSGGTNIGGTCVGGTKVAPPMVGMGYLQSKILQWLLLCGNSVG